MVENFRFNELHLVHYINDDSKHLYYCLVNSNKTKAYLITQYKIESFDNLKYYGQLDLSICKIKVNEFITRVQQNHALLSVEDVKHLEHLINLKQHQMNLQEQQKRILEIESIFEK